MLGDPDSFLPRRSGIGWDLELQMGLRIVDSDEANADFFMGRAQAGVLLVREPWVLALDATAEFGGIADPGFGGQVSLTHIWSGLWGHLGASSARTDDMVISMGAGITLFGLEFERRMDFDGSGQNALFAVLRVPIGTAFFLFTTRPTTPDPVNYESRTASSP